MNMKLRSLSREPLFHFLAIGIVLFAIAWMREGASGPEQSTIVISDSRIASLASAWKIQNGSEPNAEELRNILIEDVDEEIFYREALSMGLDQDDRIIRRRLAQKLRFLVEDTLSDTPPSEDDLKAWYAAHAADYSVPARITFRQVYFSPTGGQDTETAAQAALASWSSAPQSPPQGDPSILPEQYNSVRQARINNDFGRGFWKKLEAAPQGEWSGPLESAFGFHLVYVDSREPETQSDFSTIRDRLAQDYQAAEKKRVLADRLREIRSRYDIVVHGVDLTAK